MGMEKIIRYSDGNTAGGREHPMSRRLAVAVLVLGLAGCGTPTAQPAPVETAPPPVVEEVVDQTPGVQRNVRAGAFCSPEGARGITKTGTKVECTTTPKDERARWRRDDAR